MPKRRNDNAQMRREDYEAIQDKESSEPAGVFRKAAPEVLKRRKRVKVRRRHQNAPGSNDTTNVGGSAPGASGASSNPFASVTMASEGIRHQEAAANPFGNFSMTSPAKSNSASNSKGSSAEGLSSSGKASFSFGNTDASDSSKPTFSFKSEPAKHGNGQLEMSKSSNSMFSFVSKPAERDGESVGLDLNGNSTLSAVAQLNSAFAQWVQEQMSSHGTKSWHQGLSDYIRHMEEIMPGSLQKNNLPQKKAVATDDAAAMKREPGKTSPAASGGFTFVAPKPSASASSASIFGGMSSNVTSTSTVGGSATGSTQNILNTNNGASASESSADDRDNKKRLLILYRYAKDAQDKLAWKKLGKSSLVIDTSAASGKARLIARDTTPLAKVLVNSWLHPNMPCSRVRDKFVKVALFEEHDKRDENGDVVGKETKLVQYQMKLKNSTLADELHSDIQKLIPKA